MGQTDYSENKSLEEQEEIPAVPKKDPIEQAADEED